MGVLKVMRKTNADINYLHNAVRYVNGGHTDPDYMGSPNTDIYNAFYQMNAVKNYFGKTGGNQLFHFIIVYTPRSAYDVERAMYLTTKIAEFYAGKYQIIWCVHYKPMSKKYGSVASLFHAHIVMNSVSYMDGKMFSDTYAERTEFLNHIKKITGDNAWKTEYCIK